MPGCELVGAVDTNAERARDFAAAFQIPTAFGSLAEAIAWGAFDAAVNATPDGAHKATTLELIAAGKPVFCEKPLAPTYADALAMTEAAEAAGLVNMVNLTYRNADRDPDGPAHGRGRRDRRGPPRAGELPAVLADRAALGRLAHRGALAVAAQLGPRLQGRARRHRRAHPRLRHLRHRPRHRRAARPDAHLRQGRGRRDRRLQARRQRQRRDHRRVLQRRARRRST